MTGNLRKSGIDVLGNIPWGTHFCQFYETQQDLLETEASYFKAGLENNEYCLWILAEPGSELPIEKAANTLRKSLPDLDRYLIEGNMEIISREEWFFKEGIYDLQSVIFRFYERLNKALENGFDGMRVNGGSAWLLDLKEKSELHTLEHRVNQSIANQRLLILCNFPLRKTLGKDIFDLMHNHKFGIARRYGRWEVFETPELLQAKEELKMLNSELEQRVTERTRQLNQVIEKLQVEIAERKKAQEELVVEKELSNEILNNIPAMVVLIDKNYGYMRWNKQLELATGLTAKQLLKAHAVEDFFKDEKSKNAAYKLLHEAFEKGIAQGDVTPLFPNMEATFHVIIRRITYEGQTCLLVLGSDISERKKAEEQLNESYLQIRSLTEHLQNIREEEQTRIAREIHDVLGQQLTVMKINVNLLNGKVANSNEQVKVKLQELSGLIDETIQTVRKISSELRPKLLDDLGLVAAMDWHLKEFEKQSGIRTYFNEPEEEWELSEKTKTGLFRIFQEALTNVARHAQATQVQVALTKNNGQLRLSITDNGKGFSLQEAAQKKTLGMLGMKERTAIIGGDYQIHSEPGKGTSVIILLPIQNKS